MTFLKRIDLPLAGIVAAATVFISYWSLQVDEWGLMTDELLYSKLALSFGLPRVRGEYFAQFTPVYPVLIAPVLALFDMPTAFKAAHFVNALLMASAAIPAFLIAHRVSGSRVIGYLVAAITVVVPWVVYANMLITESAAYPIFLWTIFAILRAVDEPGVRRDVIAIAAVGIATLTRTQFAVLGVVFVLAALAHDLAYRPAWARTRPRGPALWGVLRNTARNHVALLVAAGLGMLALAALELAGGLQQGAGQYGNTLTGDLLPHGISRSFRAHLAVVTANIAVVPLLLAIAWGLAALLRPASKLEHAFALVLGLTVVAVALESASVNVRTIGLVQERYAFYIAPLIVTGALCFAARPRLAWVGIPAGTIVSIWILAKLDFGLQNSYSFVSPFYKVLDGRAADFGSVLGYENLNPGGFSVWVTVLAALAFGALIRWAPPPWRVAAVAVPVFVYCALAANYDFDKLLPAQDSAQARVGLETAQQRERGLDWVDDVLPDGAQAAFTPAVLGDIETTRRAWWDAEYWNKALVRMYYYEPAWHDSVLPTQRMRLDLATGALTVQDPMPYVVAAKSDRRLGIDGRPLAGTGLLSLLEARQPLRARWAVSNTDADGWPALEKGAVVRVFPTGSSPARVRVNMQLTSSPHHPPRTRYRIIGGEQVVSGAVPRAQSRRVSVPACVRPGAPEALRVLVPVGGVLPPGRSVGLAITGVQIDPAGRCAR